MIPIFLRGRMWGVIGFCDTSGGYSLSENDEAILLSGGLLIVNALFRYEMTHRLKATAAELENALIKAQAASDAKSNFLSSMSHEMRTPMNAIIGMSAIGKKAADIVRKDYAFERTEAAGNHLLGVIDDVLDMSKIEAGMLTLSAVPFELSRTIDKAVMVNSFRMEEKNQILEIEIDPKLPKTLVADDQRLTQALTNLLSNAVKFTSANKKIRIEAWLVETAGDICTIRFNVADQGIGLSPQQQETLFMPFVQAEHNTTRKYGGTGLGLAISKHIVELMNGEIWIESELGRGATFSFAIQAREETAVKNAEHEYDLATVFPGKRLLLAEDVDVNREIVMAILEDSRIEITCAENGEEACNIFAANPAAFDIIFMDVHMPVLDGFDATARIRSHPRGANVPIVAMTAYVFREDIEKCLNAGMNAHLGKPLDINAVFDTLRKYL